MCVHVYTHTENRKKKETIELYISTSLSFVTHVGIGVRFSVGRRAATQMLKCKGYRGKWSFGVFESFQISPPRPLYIFDQAFVRMGVCLPKGGFLRHSVLGRPRPTER